MNHPGGALAGGRLNQAIADAAARSHQSIVGRGPRRARAFYRGNVVVILLEDPMTRAETGVVRSGGGEAVLGMRRRYGSIMRADRIADVEALTGCRVEAFMSDNVLVPALTVELLVLDGMVPVNGPGGAETL